MLHLSEILHAEVPQVPDKEATGDCSLCGKRIIEKREASLTQWMFSQGSCRCAQPADTAPNYAELDSKQSNPATLCRSCGKPEPGARVGSMTQWVFRSDMCSCDKSQLLPPEDLHATNESSRSPANIEARWRAENRSSSQDAAEPLDVSPESFPLDRYIPLAVLGSGSNGVVYKARDRLLRKKVAIKLIRGNIDAQQVIRFQKEAQSIGKLTHPGLVQIHDVGATSGQIPYMVLEFVDAMPLSDLIAIEGPLDVETAVQIAAQICQALQYMHRKGVIHRDIKPSNIMVSHQARGWSAKVIDFGLASFLEPFRESGALTQAKSIVGSPNYMSPEQVEGTRIDERSDVYALGCVVFEILTGSTPFYSETALVTMRKHVEEQPPRLSDVFEGNFPDAIEGALMKALSKDPERRFQSMEEFENALLGKTNRRPARSGGRGAAPNAVAETHVPKRKPKRNVIVIASAVLGVLGLSVLLLVARNSSEGGQGEPSKVSQRHRQPRGFSNSEIRSEEKSVGVNNGHHVGSLSDMVEDQMSVAPYAFSKKEQAARPAQWEQDLAGIPVAQPIPVVSLGLNEVRDYQLKYLANRTIRELYIGSSNLTNSGLKVIATIKSLKTLDLNFSKNIGDEGVRHLARLKELESLGLAWTKITDQCLKYLANNPRLNKLDLSWDRNITGKGFVYLKNLKNLRIVLLDQTSTDGRELRNLPFVNTLQVSTLKDDDIVNLRQLKSLMWLNLTGSDISDAGLKELAKIPTLKEINITTTNVSKKGIFAVKKTRPELKLKEQTDTAVIYY